jgi:hypothetical protein
MNMGPFRWILQTKGGMQAYLWLLHLWGGSGIEDGEDMLTLLALGLALLHTLLICKITHKLLKKFSIKGMNVFFYRLITKILVATAQVILILGLTIILGYFILNLGPINYLLTTQIGRNAHHWIMSIFGWKGCESALDTLIVVSYSAVLPVAIWLCVLLKRCVKTLRDRGCKKCSPTP